MQTFRNEHVAAPLKAIDVIDATDATGDIPQRTCCGSIEARETLCTLRSIPDSYVNVLQVLKF